MSKKRDKFGRLHHPGKLYRAYKRQGFDNKDWINLQKEFRRKKRIRRISRLARKGLRPKRTMRPVLV